MYIYIYMYIYQADALVWHWRAKGHGTCTFARRTHACVAMRVYVRARM